LKTVELITGNKTMIELAASTTHTGITTSQISGWLASGSWYVDEPHSQKKLRIARISEATTASTARRLTRGAESRESRDCGGIESVVGPVITRQYHQAAGIKQGQRSSISLVRASLADLDQQA
jgi:hypothetical protein